MKKQELKIELTARYFQLGEITNTTKEIWIVLHGYGKLANYFLRNFEGFETPQRVIIAPEGLHRFYTEGFSGRVGASWMTKEERETDIQNYINYLDTLIESLQLSNSIKINLLGFSQGAATALRWVALGNVKVTELVIWGGIFPPDIDYTSKQDIFSKLSLKIVFGTEDEFYSPEQVQKVIEDMTSSGLDGKFISYKGGHFIEKEILTKSVFQ